MRTQSFVVFLIAVAFTESDESKFDSEIWFNQVNNLLSFFTPVVNAAACVLLVAVARLFLSTKPESVEGLDTTNLIRRASVIFSLTTWRDMKFWENSREDIVELFVLLSGDSVRITPKELEHIFEPEEVPEILAKYDVDNVGSISMQGLRNMFPTYAECQEVLDKLYEEHTTKTIGLRLDSLSKEILAIAEVMHEIY